MLILALCGLAAAQEPITVKNSSQALRQAELLDRQGDWSAAALVLNQMLEANAPLTTANDKHLRGAALLSAAKVARKLGNHDEALRRQLAYRRLLFDIPNADLLIEQRCENTLAIAESQLLQGRFYEAQATIEELLQGKSGPVPTLSRIEANLLAGAAHHLKGRADSAKRHWQAAADAATGVLRDSRSLSITAHLRFAALSLTAHEALDDSKNAEQEFEQALRRLDSSDKSSVDRFEARYAAFARARLRRDLARTERHLRDLTREPLVASRSLLAADLFWTLASLQRDLDRTDDARTTSRQALTMYSAAAAKIEASLSAAPESANAAVPASKRALLSCLRRLCALQQELGDLTAALRSAAQVRQLTVDLFSENPTAIVEAKTTEAILLAASGNYEAARPALSESVTFWRQQADAEPLKLARALNDLAAVERGIGNLSAAVAGFREALQLRKQHLTADDPELAMSFRNLAGAYAALGQFVSAIELHQQVLESCARRGSRADGLQSTTLLEMAIAYKSQGLYPRATELCRKSLSLQEATFGPEHFGAVAHHDALAALARLERRLADAEQHAQTMLRLCELHHREQHELAAAAWYHLGIVAASQGRLDAADAYWRKTLSIQQANGQQTLAARTWNRLGVLAYRKQELTEAERCFESALQLQDATSPRIQDRYSSLCNLAVIRQEQKELPAALELLREAIELTEAPRAATIGAEQERAEYLAQFATAFDLLFDWSLRSGQIGEAFAVAERSRSRTFLDQLRLAGIDLRRSLTGDSHQTLVAHEAEARAAVQRLQTELQSRLANRSSAREVADARQRLLAAQREFTEAWVSIRNANPIYRELLTSRDRLLSLPEIQSKCLTDGEFMLYYHLGSRRSDVLLIGGGKHVPQRFELQLPVASIDLLKSSATRSPTKPDEPDLTRGASGLVISEKGADLSDGDDSPALRTCESINL